MAGNERGDAVDILAFAPHPDDVELCAGGLLLKAAAAGRRCVIVDLTRGEAGTHGTAEQRAREAQNAAKVLRLVARENLGLPDGALEANLEMEEPVVAAIRRWRPRLVVGPCIDDRHPDHLAAARLVRSAYYGATIARRAGGGLPPHRADAWIQYFGHLEPEPSFVVDVSDVWAARLEAVRCYVSQVGAAREQGAPATNIAAPDFERRMEVRFAYWGARIGAQYGEPFRVDRCVPLDDPVQAFHKRGRAVL
jgi:bacillithiol biosynthesis deacetylase BshB1